MSETTIWEDTSHDIASTVSDGKVAKHYRLTDEFLYFESTALRSDSQQIPMAHVVDVDLKQSMIQRSRKVADIHVHVKRPGRNLRETVVLSSVNDGKRVVQLINETAYATKLRYQQLENTRTYATAAAPVPADTAPAAQIDVIAQLKQLGELRDAGVVTPEEFEAKKTEMLKRL